MATRRLMGALLAKKVWDPRNQDPTPLNWGSRDFLLCNTDARSNVESGFEDESGSESESLGERVIRE